MRHPYTFSCYLSRLARINSHKRAEGIAGGKSAAKVDHALASRNDDHGQLLHL